MMKNLTIRWRIGASFVLILVLMTGLAVLAYVRLTRIEAETASVEQSALGGMAVTITLERAWSDSLSLTTQRVLAPESKRTDDALQSNRVALRAAIDAAQTSSVTPNTIRVLEEFKSAYAAYTQVQDQLLDDAADPVRRPQASQFLGQRLLPAFERGQGAVYSLLELHRGYAKDSVATLNSDVVAAVAGTKSAVIIDLLGALALSVLCCVGLMLSIMRPLATLKEVVGMMRAGDFTRRVSLSRNDEFGALAGGFNGMADDLTVLVGQVKDSGIKVSTSVTEIAATAREQQATANEVAATTAEIGATSREISATSKELARTMADVSQAAEQSATIAGNGQVSLTQMEQSMRNVVEAASSVTTKLATLNDKAGDISQVVVTITKVADQTNLLSLNAAIEAEKAGEYGRGFAVVATEIRRLADQTAVATHDIDRMVKAMQSAVSSGVMSMDKFSDEVRRGMHAIQQVGGQLSEVIQHTQALAPRFEAVTEGMQAQATGAEQITESLTQLGEAARQTVDSLRQSSAAIDDLNQVALSLKMGVSKFTLQPA
jgi:methyl-accepting chemotaxis protein WspA